MHDRLTEQRGVARRRLIGAVGLLMAVDLAFIAGFVLHRLTARPAAWWVALHKEGTAPEIFQYGKEATIALFAVALWRVHRVGAYLWTAALFVVLLLDDALAMHERGGAHLAKMLELGERWRLRAVDFGELMVVGAIGGVMLPGMLIAHWRADRGGRKFLWLLYAGLASLAVIGVAGDMLNIMLRGTELFYATVILEDGGEMLAMSVLVGLMLWQWSRRAFEPDEVIVGASRRGA